MTEINIRGVPINFPYDAYDIQKNYMEKVIECLQLGNNGILESPTGTGKTLSLLCSSLAWLQLEKAKIQMRAKEQLVNDDKFFTGLKNSFDETSDQSSYLWNQGLIRPPRVIYASRTHSQLTQVMLELKKTAYSYVKVGVLGSRDQLCIHPRVSTETNVSSKTNLCKVLVSQRSCQFYNNVENKIQDPTFQSDRLIDLEDLILKGRKANCCPYYASRELQRDADILFAPYNYLLDPKIRKSFDIRLSNDVIILDEGHNVEKVCEESSSAQLTSTTLALCINEVTTVMQMFHSEIEQQNTAGMAPEMAKDFTADDLCILKTMFMVIEKAVDEIQFTENDSAVFPGSYVFQILEKASITFTKLSSLLEILNKVSQFLMNVHELQVYVKGTALFKFTEFIEVVFNSLGRNHSSSNTDFYYKLYVEKEVIKQNRNSFTNSTEKGKILNFWCFSPSFGMKSLVDQGIRCVILTSGTLSPISATVSEIGIPFNIQLSNPHIIKSDQICAVVVENGPSNNQLRCVYQNRSNKAYLSDLGLSCLNLYRIIPGGVLVFFPSYPFLTSCMEYWKSTGIWDKLVACKPIFIETQNKDAMKSIMNDYYKLIDENCKASLFAVCRGKVSEGLDFSDAKARAVIVIGLPLPPYYDARVSLKRKYLDNACTKSSLATLSGDEWYKLEAIRAVNQAVGRVIRHKEDHGAVIFFDCRYSEQSNFKSLSRWLQSYVVTYKTFGPVMNKVNSFFRSWKETQGNDASSEKNSSVGVGFNQSVVNVTKIQPAQKLASTSSESIAHISSIYNQPKEAAILKSQKVTVPTKNFLDSLENYHSRTELQTNNSCCLAELQKKETDCNQPVAGNSTSQTCRKRKLTIAPLQFDKKNTTNEFDAKQYALKLQKSLNRDDIKKFKSAVTKYTERSDYKQFITEVSDLFLHDEKLHLFYKDVPHFLKTDEHKQEFWKTYSQAIKNRKL